MTKTLPWPLTSIEHDTVRQVAVEYSDHLDDKGVVIVTAWSNGEGYDVYCGGNESSELRFVLTTSQFTALKHALHYHASLSRHFEKRSEQVSSWAGK